MRSLLLTARTRYGAGLDGSEEELTCCAGGYASVAMKSRFEGLVLHVFCVRILAMCIGLPDFENRVGDWSAVAIQHSPVNGDSLAGNAQVRKVVAIQPSEAKLEERANCLRRRGLGTHSFSFSIGVASRPRRMMSKR